MSKRRKLQFKSFDEVAADVVRLRHGYSKAGNWSLEQVCYHLAKAFAAQLSAVPGEASAEQKKARPVFEQVLATGEVPSGLQAPEFLTPPPATEESAIDEFLAMLEVVKRHEKPVTMHRRFGPMNLEEFHKLGLAHCAHHLGNLTPAKK